MVSNETGTTPFICPGTKKEAKIVEPFECKKTRVRPPLVRNSLKPVKNNTYDLKQPTLKAKVPDKCITKYSCITENAKIKMAPVKTRTAAAGAAKVVHSDISEMCLEQIRRLYPTPIPVPCSAALRSDMTRRQMRKKMQQCREMKISKKEEAIKCASFLSDEVNDLVAWLSEEALVHRPRKLLKYFADILEGRAINDVINQIFIENIMPLSDEDPTQPCYDDGGRIDYGYYLLESSSASSGDSRSVSFPSVDDRSDGTGCDAACAVVDPEGTRRRVEVLKKLGLAKRDCWKVGPCGLDLTTIE